MAFFPLLHNTLSEHSMTRKNNSVKVFVKSHPQMLYMFLIAVQTQEDLSQACFLYTFEKTQGENAKLNVLAFGQKLKDFFSKNSKL